MQIFILNGMARAGKDTFYNFIEELTDNTFHFSIIDLVKHHANSLGWNNEKNEKSRKFLYDLKQLTDNYNDMNFKFVLDKLNSLDSNTQVVFIDMREMKDISRAIKELNAKTVFVSNLNVTNVLSNEADANVFDIEYDIVIDNSGTLDDLKEKAIDFINKYIKG